MGSSVSVKARPVQPQVYCQKHPTNSVTHILVDSDRLVCLSCFNGINKSLTNDYNRSKCKEIDSYTESVVFKQSESRVIKNLRLIKDDFEKEKNDIKALMSDVIQKRSKLQREVKGFVENVIALLRFLETDLIKRINVSFQKVLYDIGIKLNSSKTDLESIRKLENSLDRKQDKIIHLQSVLDAKIFLKEFKETERVKLSNPIFVLKLNKRLTLKQILGNEDGKSNVSLGELKVENTKAKDDQSIDILSDITDVDTFEENASIKQTRNRFSYVNVGTETTELERNVNKRLRDECELTKGDSKQRVKSRQPFQTGPRGQVEHVSRRSSSSMAFQGSGITPRSHSVQSRLSSRTPRASKLSITTPSGIALTDRPIVEDDEDFVQVHLEKWREVELQHSTLTRNITDSIELENGDIVLCDQKNKELVLLGGSLIPKDTLRLHSNPHNLSVVSRDKLVVTLPEENFIMRIDIENNGLVESDFKIHASTKCRGIEHVNNQIFYTCKNSIFLTEGADSYKIERAFKQPVSLTSEENKHIMHVCCRGNKSRDERGEVVTMNTTSLQVISALFHEQLKDPVSCTVDDNGNLFVCDVQPPSSIHVARYGTYSHVVLGSVNEKYQHIRYMSKMGLFMITENDNNVISFYKLRRYDI